MKEQAASSIDQLQKDDGAFDFKMIDTELYNFRNEDFREVKKRVREEFIRIQQEQVLAAPDGRR